MRLYGSFVSKRKEVVRVEIVSRHDHSRTIEIGGADRYALFPAESPVEIRCEVDDTFEPLFRTSATVRVLTRGLLEDLFCESALDAVVNITVNDRCVFAGYVEPQTYSQPFNASYDELEINCIDAISAMQFFKYRNIGSLGVTYESVRATAGTLSMERIVTDIFEAVTLDLDLQEESRAKLLYDGSVTLTDGGNIFSGTSLSELLFLGASEDETWSMLDVMEEIARYYNLHMVQDGFRLLLYSLDTARINEPEIEWQSLDGTPAETETRTGRIISVGNTYGDGAQVSIGEVYNRLELTCEVTETENLIESPLDSDTMKSPYSNKQLYMTEYISEGEGDTAHDAFKNIVEGKPTTYDQCMERDWYMQVYTSAGWRFSWDGLTADGKNQHGLPNWLAQNAGSGLISFGKVEHKGGGQDNSVIGKVDMTTALVVSVNGNGKDSQTECYPNADSLLAASPVAEYIGNVSGGVFSPPDEDTVNYIVISGSLVLNPLLAQSFEPSKAPWVTGTWPPLASYEDGKIHIATVPSKNNDDGRFYATKWFVATTPTSTPLTTVGPGLLPYTGDVPEQYEFSYSAIGDGTDRISKVAVLSCMLIIGDKCVVEKGTEGSVSDFEWRTYKTREECASDDEYYAQCFTIGFDPKIGDKLIGTEFDVQNNIDYTLGLDQEGTAIPIRHTDKVSGKVTFRILGAVNTLWDDVTRRHPTWFRHTQWKTNSIPLMAHVSSIMIRDFEMKVCSDNGLINNTDDCDLVYMSDTREQFVNVKDDLRFRITTALTKTERIALGISDSVKLSSPLEVATGTPLLAVSNAVTGDEGKPEQLYVDSYYQEYSTPRVTMTHRFRSETDPGLFDHYRHPALPDKVFYAIGSARDLMEGWVEMTLKER